MNSNSMATISYVTITTNPCLFSEKKGPCGGRCCARCGKCRDWSWTPYVSCCSDIDKTYTKRDDATCTGIWGGTYDNQYNCQCCYGGGSYYHYFLACCCFGRHCECLDNQS